MRDRTFEHIGALSGLAFFILAVLSGFIYPQQPRVDSAPVKTLDWVHDHHAALEAGMIFDFFAAGVLLWFAGYLYRVLRHAEGETGDLAPMVLASGMASPSPQAIAALAHGVAGLHGRPARRPHRSVTCPARSAI